MGAKGKNLHNVERNIEFYADKLHHIDQQIDVSIFYYLWLFFEKWVAYKLTFVLCFWYFPFVGSITINVPYMLLIFFICWKRNKGHKLLYFHHFSSFLLLYASKIFRNRNGLIIFGSATKFFDSATASSRYKTISPKHSNAYSNNNV